MMVVMMPEKTYPVELRQRPGMVRSQYLGIGSQATIAVIVMAMVTAIVIVRKDQRAVRIHLLDDCNRINVTKKDILIKLSVG